MRLPPWIILFGPRVAQAACQCGFSVAAHDDDKTEWLFTDLLESDFNKIKDIGQDLAWIRQQFNVTAKEGRGKYAKDFRLENVKSLPASSSGERLSGDIHGLGLTVERTVQNDAVPVAEIDSSRQDLFWGSFRAGMKLTDVNGTCAAFFWYFNDTQEIDIEFLSKEFDKENNIYPVNLVIQTEASQDAGYDASKTGNFVRANLSFDPTDDFHEYRFDYLPREVNFYADSQLLHTMAGSAIPSSGGHLILQHWSNGNPLWSGGPPNTDAVLTVSYVKAYFNSSDTRKQTEWARTCDATKHDHTPCIVEDVTAANASTGGRFFGDNRSTGGGGQSGTGDEDDEDNGGMNLSQISQFSLELFAGVWLLATIPGWLS